MVVHTCSAPEDHVTLTCIVRCPQISKVIQMLVRWHADGPDSEPSRHTSVESLTAPQHLVCRAVQSLHINHMQMGIIEVFICRCLHMNTLMIPICIWLICRLCTALHTKCCGAVPDYLWYVILLPYLVILFSSGTCMSVSE